MERAQGSGSGKNMTQFVHSTIVQADQITALHVIFYLKLQKGQRFGPKKVLLIALWASSRQKDEVKTQITHVD